MKAVALQIGGNFNFTSSAGADDLFMAQVEVDGATKLALGDGVNTVDIEESTFVGTVNLTTGKGDDTITISTDTNIPGSILKAMCSSTWESGPTR